MYLNLLNLYILNVKQPVWTTWSWLLLSWIWINTIQP